MAQYSYQARDSRGQLVAGVITAGSLEEAGRRLYANEQFVIELKEAKDDVAAMKQASSGGLFHRAAGRGVKRDDLIYVVNQLAVMMDTGIPISEALDSLASRQRNDKFRAVLENVTSRVHAGEQLSTAAQAYPGAFPPIFTALVRAGEASGSLTQMLDRCSAYMGKEQKTRKQVRGALMYPLFMVLMCLGTMVFLLTFVLPRFAAIYADRGSALPAPTRLLMAMSNGLVNYWMFWAAGSVAAVIGLMLFSRTGTGRRTFDWMKLNLPIASNLFRQLYITRATRTFSALIRSGVTLLDAVDIVKDITRNTYFDQLWDKVSTNIKSGQQLSDGLFESDLIPEEISEMIFSGEKAGRLSDVLGRVAEFTENEFDQAVKTTTQFIEPVMIVVMGSMIGFVAISLLLPIFSIGQVVAGK